LQQPTREGSSIYIHLKSNIIQHSQTTMGKQSKRRIRQQKLAISTSVASTAILISSAVVVAANIHASTYHNNDDPAAAPSNNIHCDNQHREEGNSLIPPSTHTLSTVFSCGTSWRDASSTCSNLCPSGLDSSCPNGQSCYAGLTCSSPTSTIEINNDEKEEGRMSYEIRSHSDALLHQSQIESNLLNNIQSTNDNEYINKFICSTSHSLATQQCNTQSSNLSSYKGSLMPLTYCNVNNGNECPNSQECYVVSCPKELHIADNKGVVELLTMENVGSWLVNKFTLFTPSSQEDEADKVNHTAEDENNRPEEDEEDRAVFSTWTSYFTEMTGKSSVLRLSLDMISKN